MGDQRADDDAMTTTEIPTTMTAIKTWKGDKATVTVTIVDPTCPARSFVSHLGGKRAARATAAIVTQWEGHDGGARDPGVFGLRADMGKAQGEAAGLLRTEMRTRYGVVPLNPALWAVAIPVTDAQA